MFFTNSELDGEMIGYDISSEEGRQKLREVVTRGLKDAPPEKRSRFMKLLEFTFGIAGELPSDFALVHELVQEAGSIERLIEKRQLQLREMTKRYSDRDMSNCFGSIDSFLTVIGGSLGSIKTYSQYLERRLIELDNGKKDGPSGRETPTEPPPAPPAAEPQATAEAPLG